MGGSGNSNNNSSSSSSSSSGDRDKRLDVTEGDTRPQRGGEAETTRFGMEDGDNTDIPATGGASPAQDLNTRCSRCQ